MRKKAVVRPMYNNHVDADHDLLTCGDCQREFVLSDIVQFVQHKVNRCNCNSKDKCSPGFCEDDADFDDGQETTIRSKHTSISAPIAKKESDKDRLCPQTPHCDKKSADDDDDQSMDKSLTTDSAVNTDASESSSYAEPYNYVCHTCKSIYKTAWFLVQHVQTVHGIKVYSDHSVDPEVYEGGSTPVQQKKHHSIASIIADQHKTPPRLDEERRPQSTTSSVSSASSLHSRTPAPQQSSPIDGAVQPPPSFPFSRAPIIPTSTAAAMAAFHPGPFSRPPFTPGDMSMVNSELLGEMPFRRLPPFLPPGLEHALPPGFPFRPNTIPDRNTLDIYSQRLKRLAFNPAAVSPSSHPPSSPARRPFSAHSRDSSFSVTPPAQETSDSSPEKPLLPPKTKPCEFCGKCFRFHSNLIVHRRMHTGEKPYRCPLCSHTCGQASKLKKHMKVHIQSQLAAAGISLPLGGAETSAQEKKESGHNESEDDFDELEEEEAAAKEAQAEAELRQFADQVKQHQIELQQLKDKQNVKEEPVDLASDDKSEKSEKDKLLSNEQKLAVLNEIMEDSGLANIEQYQQAYNEAVAESSRPKEDEDLQRPNSTGSLESERSSLSTAQSSTVKENGVASSPPSTPNKINREASPSPPPTKKVKAEPAEGTAVLTSGANPFMESVYQRSDAIYPSGIWFPPAAGMPRDLFSGAFRPEAVLPHQIPLEDDSRSALKMSSPKTMPAIHAVSPSISQSSSASSPMMSGGLPLRKRNDTCEYCGKVFKNCSNLTVHRRSHTGEKPYKCALCSYACAQSSKLTRHMKTHGRLGKDVYRCKFCNMPFSVASTLEKHMRKCVENQQHRGLPADPSLMLSLRGSCDPTSTRTSPSRPLGSPAVSAATF